MLADLAKADVVFVGEQHDDPNTHRLEAAILDGLRRRGVPVTLSLEMFERDAQAGLDTYLAGAIAEEEFLKTSRPVAALRDRLPVARRDGQRRRAGRSIASNVPRRHASSVAKTGLSALDGLPPAERAWVAADLQCPRDVYFDRFRARRHRARPPRAPAGEKPSAASRAASEDSATTERYYFSQCVKDETMAEAIAAGFERVRPEARRPRQRRVPQRLRPRHCRARAPAPGRRRVAVVSVLPVKDLDTLAPAGDDLKRADYLVYTIGERKK